MTQNLSTLKSNLSFYKPNKQEKGCALQFQLSTKQEVVYNDKEFLVNYLFLTGAHQKGKNENGNAIFDWQNGITIKLGLNDIGELLAVLSNRQGSAQLYHQTPKDNKIIKLQKEENGTYRLGISQKVGGDADRMQQTLSTSDASILYECLRYASLKLLGWV